MISKEVLELILRDQKQFLLEKETGMVRNDIAKLQYINNFAMIVSGIRRCGKSTLLHQILQNEYPEALYFNFDDPRLFDFEMIDFSKLDLSMFSSSN